VPRTGAATTAAAQSCIAASSSVPKANFVLVYVVPAVMDTVTSVEELKAVIVPVLMVVPEAQPEVAHDSNHLFVAPVQPPPV